MHRQKLKELLPTIVVEKTPETEIEKFQTEVLRPILKYQNQIILKLFLNQVSKTKTDLNSLSVTQKHNYIQTLIKNNKTFQSTLIGLVIAFFTEVELTIYLKHSTELNKRLSAFLIERIYSQV